MAGLQPITYNLAQAEDELQSFKAWLAMREFVGEKAIVAEIAKRPQMACLLGITLNIPAPDLIKFELTLLGLFRTDLVLGHDRSRTFAMIEFEPAEEQSLFKKGTAQYRYWGAALEHGFGQIIDWAWITAKHPNNVVLENSLGGKLARSAFAVICGRDAGIDPKSMEQERLDHRRHLITIGGSSAQIMTYDGMIRSMEENLAISKTYI